MRLKEKQETDVSEAKGSKYFKKDGAIHLLEVMVLSRSVKSDFCNPMDCSSPGFSVHGILQARMLEWIAMPFSRGSFPNSGIKLRSCALQVGSLQSEPPGKP